MMKEQLPNSKLVKSKILFLITILFVYVILFEFILPFNKVLPKPSLLLESFISVWKDYSLVESMAITTTTIYLTLAISYLVISLISGYLLKIFFEFPEVIEKLKIFRYFPAFFFAILFSYWFANSIAAEILFAFLSSCLLMISVFLTSTKTSSRTYFDVAMNLGLKGEDIYRQVAFKNIQPKFISESSRIHYYLWILVMIYEFINEINGFGGVYRIALMYNDFSGLFSFAIVISLLIWFGDIVIKFIHEKIVFWEA